MPRWAEIEAAVPDFAARVQRLFDAGRHKTIATVRADGAPRISGIECEFADGDLRFGSMAPARKLADLTRDGRFALHGPTFHPEEGNEAAWPGEAKLTGVATAQTGDEGSESFVCDIHSVTITCLNPEATRLVVEWWTPDAGLQRIERE